MIDDTVAMKMDSLIFTAGSEKQEKAFMIARKSCAFVLGHCRCFYVDGYVPTYRHNCLINDFPIPKLRWKT